jgi:sec-independent protein translocase protein TatB
MFDIGFSEIVIIAVVALIVIGPENLPKTARTLGHLFGRLQRYVSDVKADINRELELEELRKLQQQVQTAATELQTSMTAAAHEVESGVRTVESEMHAAGQSPPATPPREADAFPSGLIVPPPEPSPEPAAAPAPPRQASLPGFDRG